MFPIKLWVITIKEDATWQMMESISKTLEMSAQ